MTGCLYISPGVIPALIADTMVSMTPMGNEPKILPSTVAHHHISGTMKQSRLARKIFVLDDMTAVSVAGVEEKIKEFLQEVYQQKSAILSTSRPMRHVGDIANNYDGKVNVLGASVMFEKDDYKINLVAPRSEPWFDTEVFQKIGAIGSGADKLIWTLKKYKSQILSGSHKDVPFNPFELIRGTASALNTIRLRDEIFEMGPSRSWGGFLEHIYFDPKARKWIFGTSSIHFFFVAKELDNGQMTAGLFPRIICYDPGELFGRVMSVVIENGQPLLAEWILDSIVGGPEKIPLTGLQYWSNWKPDSATVNVTWFRKNGTRSTTKSTNIGEQNEIIFRLSEGDFHVGLSDNIIAHICSEVFQAWGFKYVKST